MPTRYSRSNPSRSSGATAAQSGSNSSRRITPAPSSRNTGDSFVSVASTFSPSGPPPPPQQARTRSSAAASRSGNGHENVSTRVPFGSFRSDNW